MQLYLFLIVLTISQIGTTKNIFSRRRRADDWSYDEGPNGPDHWGGVCNSGKRQSPIDLDISTAEPMGGETINLGGGYMERHSWNSSYNGHSYQAVMVNSSKATINMGSLPGTFVLQSVHFHWGAEHTVFDNRVDAELHLVHFNTKYPTSEAANHADGIAVLGILLQEEEHAGPDMSNFLEGINSGKSDIKMRRPLREILPQHLSPWWRYEGSLTTPPCSESVVWTVLARPVAIRKGLGDKLSNSYRPIQDVGNRTVYIYFDRINELSDDGNHAQTTSLSTTLIFISWITLLLRIQATT